MAWPVRFETCAGLLRDLERLPPAPPPLKSLSSLSPNSPSCRSESMSVERACWCWAPPFPVVSADRDAANLFSLRREAAFVGVSLDEVEGEV